MAINSFDNIGKEPNDPATCSQCQCTWFELFEVKQFRAEYNTVLGQEPPSMGFKFVMMRCIKCQAIHQPNITPGRQDNEAKAYDQLLDLMEEIKK